MLHKFLHRHEEAHEATHIPDSLDSEKDKIKGAIRTDFILSAEIIIIALGVVQESTLMVKIFALSAVGIGITIFVYGLVAIIVKADDVGLYLMQAASSGKRAIGHMIIAIMPWVMRALAFVGTLAMFLVGGGIFTHNIDALHHIQWSNALIATGFDLVVGLVVGAICCAVILPLSKKLAAK